MNDHQDEPTATALVVAPTRPTAGVELWGTNEPRAMTARMGAIADACADVINQRNLFSTIQGRKYVNIEGWSMVGAMVGAFPSTKSTEIVETGHLDVLTVTLRGRSRTFPSFDGIISYSAHVELVLRDGGVVGSATAICSRREPEWRDRDDNQIASMAQTRAAAKAFRMTFGFVMPMSGYAPTPAEEMSADVVEASFQPEPPREQSRQQQSRERAPRVEQNPTVEPSPDGINNVGALLTYGINLRKFHGLPPEPTATFKALGVEVVGEIAGKYNGDWAAAAQKIRDAFQPTSQHASPDAETMAEVEAQAEAEEAIESRVGRQLTDEESAQYKALVDGGLEDVEALRSMGLVE